jgi:predicted nucleotidyltransferase
VYRFEEQVELLRSQHPEYLCHDPVLGLDVQSVPRSECHKTHDPYAYLAHLRRSGPSDAVEEDALALAEEVQQASGVSWVDLGITGSVMLGTQRHDSDLDLVVCGEMSCRAVHQALTSLLRKGVGPLRRLGPEGLQSLYALHRPDTPLAFHDFARLQGRKVNEFLYRDRPVFVRFVKQPKEYSERYGERRYQAVGQSTLSAAVHDDSDAIFTPCRYGVRDAHIVRGPQIGAIREIVSFRGRFSDQLRTGEMARGSGIIEQVVNERNEGYHRLVVGGQAGDWLLALPKG